MRGFWLKTQKLELPSYGIGSAIPITILVFILHFFPGEINDKIFLKNENNHNLGPF